MEQTDDLPVRMFGAYRLHAGHNLNARPDEVAYGVEAVQRVEARVVPLSYAQRVIGLGDASVPQLLHLPECEVTGVDADLDVIGKHLFRRRDGVEEIVQLDVVDRHQRYR